MTGVLESVAHESLQALLYREFDFVMDDLCANQQGYIRTPQADRLIAKSKSYRHTIKRFLSMYGAGVALVISATMLITNPGPYVFIPIIFVWVSLFLLVFALAAIASFITRFFHQKLVHHLHNNIFEEVRGELRVYRIGSKRWADSDGFLLAVGERGFNLTSKQYEQLHKAIPPGQQAVAYYLPLSKWMILSIVLL